MILEISKGETARLAISKTNAELFSAKGTISWNPFFNCVRNSRFSGTNATLDLASNTGKSCFSDTLNLASGVNRLCALNIADSRYTRHALKAPNRNAAWLAQRMVSEVELAVETLLAKSQMSQRKG
jgi:hypothetical protein